jgi:hypothetical protein
MITAKHICSYIENLSEAKVPPVFPDVLKKVIERWFTMDWSWVDSYVVVTEWLERTREMYPEWK